MSSASETDDWTEITKPKVKKIVFNLTNWSIKGKEFSDVRVNLRAWIPKADHLKFQANDTLNVFATGRSNTGSGVQKAVKETFYEYVIPLDGVTISKANFTDLGWSFDCGGETVVFGFKSRMQNPRFPIQNQSTIESIIREINSL